MNAKLELDIKQNGFTAMLDGELQATGSSLTTMLKCLRDAVKKATGFEATFAIIAGDQVETAEGVVYKLGAKQ